MNTPAEKSLEDVTGLMLLPLPVAAQILGISMVTARRELPIVDQGYRTKSVTVADIRAYIAARKVSPLKIIK
jgi:hypothetical protein